MYGVSASNSRSRRSSTSTRSAASASRPASSSDGRSGTGSSGARRSAYGKIGASGTQACQSVDLARRGGSPGSPSDAAAVELAARQLGHEVERVDLAVRVRDRRADLGAAVLEDEDVVDVGARAERGAALGPEIDHLARAGGAERPERRVVLAACRARPRSGRPASRASGSRTSARRTDRAPRARRGRTGSSPPEGSAGSAASRRCT